MKVALFVGRIDLPAAGARRDSLARRQKPLPHSLFLETGRACAARWTPDSFAKLAKVNFQFRDGAAEGVAVHSELARRAALIALVFLQHGQDKALLEFPYTFGIENIASVHLEDECFQLVFHGALFSISLFRSSDC